VIPNLEIFLEQACIQSTNKKQTVELLGYSFVFFVFVSMNAKHDIVIKCDTILHSRPMQLVDTSLRMFQGIWIELDI